VLFKGPTSEREEMETLGIGHDGFLGGNEQVGFDVRGLKRKCGAVRLSDRKAAKGDQKKGQQKGFRNRSEKTHIRIIPGHANFGGGGKKLL